MASQIPIKVICDGSGNTCGLAQFTSSDSVAIAAGGTGLTSQGICEFTQPGLYAVGCQVTYLGICAGKTDTGAGHDNTYVGHSAGTAVTTGCQHTIIGSQAGKAITTCNGTVAVGYNAGVAQTFGDFNTLIGTAAGAAITTADNNTVIGYHAATATICSNNIAIGTCAMVANTQGQDNVAIGLKAGGTQIAAGCNNIFIGSCAGAVSLCRDNIVIGAGAGIAATTGGGNTMIGACVGYGVVGGAGNVYIGDKAGLANTSGNDNVFIGKCAGCAQTGSCCLVIGNGTCDIIVGNFNTGVICNPVDDAGFYTGASDDTRWSYNGCATTFSDTPGEYYLVDCFHRQRWTDNVATPQTSFHFNWDANDISGVGYFKNHTTALCGVIDLYRDHGATANSAWKFESMRSGTGDTEFLFQGDGNAYADGSFNDSGADYQEYFESFTDGPLTLGATVVLDGDTVREYDGATDTPDQIIGVVRPEADNKNSAVVGNTAWNHWTDKYLTDDWGVYLRETLTSVEWFDKNGKKRSFYENDPRACVQALLAEAPHDAVRIPVDARKLNPAYVPTWKDLRDEDGSVRQEKWEADVDYKPRADRDEWILVGLLGQIQIKAGQEVNPRWIKMKDISADVELWYVR